MFESLAKAIPGFILAVLRFILFIILSIVVLPSMLVMLWLHKPWEKMLDDIFTLNPF